jgi:hypothetical protein
MSQLRGNIEDPKLDRCITVRHLSPNVMQSPRPGDDTGFFESPYKPICRKRYLL